MGPVGFSVEQQDLIWAMWRQDGDAIREMERTLGETLPRIRRYVRYRAETNVACACLVGAVPRLQS